ncbi:MAG TPA: hypothetical protein VMT86_04790 [Bryobacteraceae bacterium]|nr:hypothetical protein [Bryobacteraceae bacterium]
MAESGVLAESTQERLAALGAMDLVAGIPSYNNAGTIAHTGDAIRSGLAAHFGSLRCLIVNADGGSADGTPAKLREAVSGDGLLQLPYSVKPADQLSGPHAGVTGKTSALRAILNAANTLGAKACVIFEPDVTSITPDWVPAMARPVLEKQFDFVAPDHVRHKFDGTINKSIVYPLTRALYGKRIRQPIGGDFGFSSKLMAHYLAQDAWSQDMGTFGVEIWLVTQAICGRFRICQARLGPKVRETADAAHDLSGVLVQVLGPLFQAMERDVAFWQRARGSEPVPVFGAAEEVSGEAAAIDVQKMIDSYRLGYQNLLEVWGLVLSPATLLELKRIARADANYFRMPDEVWVRTIYDYALAYRLRVIHREHLLRALTPLYLGWLASFLLEMREADQAEVDRRLERFCLAYESSKPYLISRWRWPENFNP